MCVGKCARCTGLSLMLLALLSITSNLFLLFPNLDGSYLRRRQISSYARFLSGVWAGGLMVLLASIQITTTGFKVRRLSCCGPRCDMFLSGVSSFVALLGATISLLVSVAGLFSGPYCLLQENDGAAQKWDYPKHNIFNNSSVVMVPDMSSWSGACIEPPYIETWHSSFFILMSMSNILQIMLCLSQIVNVIFGVLCGHCDQKK
ncbi:transmembrane 4 L6 family member 19 isoform X2 [Hyla sarda]|nr:transmembrane 4 L6 family member 19 isoform X2 [Hyla sarda]XP_056420418.1 transmembrane 4 L6 family member 19 isoform X2 [Hyla sarda]XP_056420419.1 transmembrane 4 L6 family member 19 isoform X2 [Hyla sarda]XP_056420420.1 transmembrane 4 L6 family member 19 isoform X2 [Hyla sarda]